LGQGDPYDTALVNESIRNLRRLRYLLKTDISLGRGEAGENIMVVHTSDKWTTVGGLSFHRTGGRSDLQIGFEENNLLGYGMFMSHDFFVLDDDRNYYQVEIGDNRLLGKNLSASIFYSDNPRAGQVSIFAARPYYSLQQKWSGQILYLREKRRQDYYLGSVLAVRDRLEADRGQLQTGYRVGRNDLKYHFILRYDYTDLSVRGRNQFLPDSILPLVPATPVDSIYHYGQFTFRLQQINYVTFHRLSRFHKAEDISLGFDGRISVGNAIGSEFKRSLYQYYSVWPQVTTRYSSALFIFGIRAQEWIDGQRTIRQRMNYYFKGFWQYETHNTLVVGFKLLSDKLGAESDILYLDEDNGLRGHPAFAYSGENRLIINLENRFFSDLEILSVGLGGVAFADIGNIWTRNRELALRDFYTSYGIGLRFGISRSTSAEIIRLDFAFAPGRNRWQVSVGTGQFF
jgi:hypothetical protein